MRPVAAAVDEILAASPFKTGYWKADHNRLDARHDELPLTRAR